LKINLKLFSPKNLGKTFPKKIVPIKVEIWNKNRTYIAIAITSLGKEYVYENRAIF